MKKTTFVAAMMVVLLFGGWVKGGVSVVVNGSFENDGLINPITEVNTPERWDVNLPDQFSGKVDDDWPTHGYYNLILYSKGYKTFEANDIATISQEVYLADVNEIIFDLKLETYPSTQPWDPNKRTVVLLIDDIVVWESNDVGSDVRGEYFDQTVDVNGIYDASPHTLTLGLRANVYEYTPIIYRTKWDLVRFDTYCEGFGYMPADLNHDCYVDMLDLEMLAGQWLVEGPAYKYDLFEDDDNIVNFLDFAVLADNWMGDSYGHEQADKLLAMDLNNDGIVNFIDFAMLAKDWDGDYGDIAKLADEWLQKSWLYGLE